MTGLPHHRVPSPIRNVLDSSGMPWLLEIGKKHMKIKLAGRLVGVLPHSPQRESDREVINTVAQIRRRVAEMRGDGTCT